MKDTGIRKIWAKFSLYIIIFKSSGKSSLGLENWELNQWVLENLVVAKHRK